VTIIAGHQPNPIRREWIKGKFVHEFAFEPVVDDRGHGDAVNLAWRLLKAGCAAELFERVSNLVPDKADKVFAMSDREGCRRHPRRISPCRICRRRCSRPSRSAPRSSRILRLPITATAIHAGDRLSSRQCEPMRSISIRTANPAPIGSWRDWSTSPSHPAASFYSS
jgi:hypothetical protein